MSDRAELLESALDSLPDGIALADREGRVAFWNRAAEAITGHRALELVGYPVRGALDELVVGGSRHWTSLTDSAEGLGRGAILSVRHKLGAEIPVMAQILQLRDGLGEQIGVAVKFHSTDALDALPRGETREGLISEESETAFKERLETIHEDFLRGGSPFGMLWIAVDQAQQLRLTRGTRACEAMLARVGATLASGLKPGEEIVRWGDDEFLVIAHERNAALLTAHAQLLAGLARTSDFRWWGDRITLTVSVGAAHATIHESLPHLLERAQDAMRSSIQVGGNHVTNAPGRTSCSPS